MNSLRFCIRVAVQSWHRSFFIILLGSPLDGNTEACVIHTQNFAVVLWWHRSQIWAMAVLLCGRSLTPGGQREGEVWPLFRLAPWTYAHRPRRKFVQPPCVAGSL